MNNPISRRNFFEKAKILALGSFSIPFLNPNSKSSNTKKLVVVLEGDISYQDTNMNLSRYTEHRYQNIRELNYFFSREWQNVCCLIWFFLYKAPDNRLHMKEIEQSHTYNYLNDQIHCEGHMLAVHHYHDNPYLISEWWVSDKEILPHISQYSQKAGDYFTQTENHVFVHKNLINVGGKLL